MLSFIFRLYVHIWYQHKLNHAYLWQAFFSGTYIVQGFKLGLSWAQNWTSEQAYIRNYQNWYLQNLNHDFHRFWWIKVKHFSRTCPWPCKDFRDTTSHWIGPSQDFLKKITEIMHFSRTLPMIKIKAFFRIKVLRGSPYSWSIFFPGILVHLCVSKLDGTIEGCPIWQPTMVPMIISLG